jgi:hypothetical protein
VRGPRFLSNVVLPISLVAFDLDNKEKEYYANLGFRNCSKRHLAVEVSISFSPSSDSGNKNKM